MAQDLVCPKCRGGMRNYERNGVTIDQCEECRGIFLDRGELERLIEAESRSLEAPRGEAAPAPSGWDYGHGAGHYGSARPGHHKRRKGFLGELFD